MHFAQRTKCLIAQVGILRENRSETSRDNHNNNRLGTEIFQQERMWKSHSSHITRLAVSAEWQNAWLITPRTGITPSDGSSNSRVYTCGDVVDIFSAACPGMYEFLHVRVLKWACAHINMLMSVCQEYSSLRVCIGLIHFCDCNRTAWYGEISNRRRTLDMQINDQFQCLKFCRLRVYSLKK